MSFFAKAAGFLAGNGDALAKPVDAIGNAFDKIFTSDDERLKAQIVLEKLRQHPMELQNALNMVDAQSRMWWQAGWRPFIGWVCGLALALYYLPQFATASVMWAVLCWQAGAAVPYPVTDISGLMELIIGLLGLGVLRTVEKIGKVAK